MKTIALGFLATTLIAGAAFAAPFEPAAPAAPVGQMYTYTAANPVSHRSQNARGESIAQIIYRIPRPPKGYYLATLAADFEAQGIVGSPVEWVCSIERNGQTLSQSTVMDDGLFDVGINVTASFREFDRPDPSGTPLRVRCQTTGDTIVFTGFPMKVTLVRMAGETQGALEDV